MTDSAFERIGESSIVHTVVPTKIMRNITLLATNTLIDCAREKACTQNVTRIKEFRKGLASYVHEQDAQSAVACFRNVL
jgi:hypothetical protein